MYSARKSARSEYIPIRDVLYHVRHWGNPDAPQLWMLHGWMDVSASFQFVVDHLAKDWHIISPDWRGFGLTEWQKNDTYIFFNYLADLDVLLQHYSPKKPVAMLGHSMGGNILLWYAGICPERIEVAINLEGVGLHQTPAREVPEKYQQWLKQLRQPLPLRAFPHIAAVAKRLQKTNPRLSDEKAAFIAEHWVFQNTEGLWELRADPAHKRTHPIPYHVEDAMACWANIQAPVLWLEGEGSDVLLRYTQEELDQRRSVITDVSVRIIEEAGHMLHHDQPEMIAVLTEQFIDEKT